MQKIYIEYSKLACYRYLADTKIISGLIIVPCCSLREQSLLNLIKLMLCRLAITCYGEY